MPKLFWTKLGSSTYSIWEFARFIRYFFCSGGVYLMFLGVFENEFVNVFFFKWKNEKSLKLRNIYYIYLFYLFFFLRIIIQNIKRMISIFLHILPIFHMWKISCLFNILCWTPPRNQNIHQNVQNYQENRQNPCKRSTAIISFDSFLNGWGI